MRKFKNLILKYNAIAVYLYAFAAFIFFAGVILFCLEIKKDWFVAGKIIWVACALGSAFRALGDVSDRLSKRERLKQGIIIPNKEIIIPDKSQVKIEDLINRP